MEKITHRPINILIVALLGCLMVLPQTSVAQIRAGSGYLKMLHGARDVSLSGTLAGALDYNYSFYANPGATGFIREWQWSATYTNWISDIYNASFLYGREIPTPWSRHTRLLVGINYLGIPEFNNADATQTAVSANNLLVTGSVGQPLFSRYFSIGSNLKYFKSALADFNTDAFIFDFGILGRTPRFPIPQTLPGLFEYWILSAGVSVTNVGSPLVFVNEETPLPETFRTGVAINAGAHHGLQFSLAADYRKVRDETGYLTFGSEISWRQIIALRFGYSREENLLGQFTFGGSIRLDDQIIQNQIVGRNNALRVDLATNQNNAWFAAPYHGTLTHQPIGPQGFRLITPEYAATVETDLVQLKWELTSDPDLYDTVNHWLLVDPDSSRLEKVAGLADENADTLLNFVRQADFLLSQSTATTEQLLSGLPAGDYFWAVLAYDRDHHFRLAQINRREIGKFRVTAPNPRVIALRFVYDPWITQDDFQGQLHATVANLGNRIARNFSLAIFDSTAVARHQAEQPASVAVPRIFGQTLPDLAPGDSVEISLDWRTFRHGQHQIRAEILQPDGSFFSNFQNQFYTIPKGIFATGDTMTVQDRYEITYDLPYVGKIFFDSSRAEVHARYVRDWVIEPPLALFAKRLQMNPEIKINLQGTIDPDSDEEELKLADQRAAAVRDTLINLGVEPGQMQIMPGIKLPPRNRPNTTIDGRWLLAERRRVDITTNVSHEEALFKPEQTTFVEKTDVPVPFVADILGAAPFNQVDIHLVGQGVADSLRRGIFAEKIIFSENVNWAPAPGDADVLARWLEHGASYALVLHDSLGREFKTHPKKTWLQTRIIGRERRYYILANFAKASAFYEFYWTNLIQATPVFLQDPKVRICFGGHGCAIGTDAINNTLSKQRSDAFQKNFLQAILQEYPQIYSEITRRTDPTRGFGESQPLEFKNPSGQVICLGENQLPLGRQLNRRVMVLFYTPR